MNVRSCPFVDGFSASSDFEEKLVTRSRVGTLIVPIRCPHGVSSSSEILDVTPKLLSTRALLKTYGYVPSAVAVTQLPALHPGGS